MVGCNLQRTTPNNSLTYSTSTSENRPYFVNLSDQSLHLAVFDYLIENQNHNENVDTDMQIFHVALCDTQPCDIQIYNIIFLPFNQIEYVIKYVYTVSQQTTRSSGLLSTVDTLVILEIAFQLSGSPLPPTVNTPHTQGLPFQ